MKKAQRVDNTSHSSPTRSKKQSRKKIQKKSKITKKSKNRRSATKNLGLQTKNTNEKQIQHQIHHHNALPKNQNGSNQEQSQQ